MLIIQLQQKFQMGIKNCHVRKEIPYHNYVLHVDKQSIFETSSRYILNKYC